MFTDSLLHTRQLNVWDSLLFGGNFWWLLSVERPGTFRYHTGTARAENMEVLPAELHAHVDAIDIEEGLYF